MKVAVVTPTIGTQHLQQCIEATQSQTYENLTHYIFIDGEAYREKTLEIISKSSTGKKAIKLISLEENVGKGWYGHRVYSACSFLVNADIICYLDEDNWHEPNHVEGIVRTIEKGNDWAYSLRKIYDKNGSFLCPDDCESLGKWSTYVDPNSFHIDTSSFGVKINVATNIGHAWYGQWGADRQFFGAVKHYFPRFDCTKQYSLCYRLDGNPNSVNEEFFKAGNQVMAQKYNNNLPWRS